MYLKTWLRSLEGHVCAIGYVSDQKSSAPEDLVKVPEDVFRVTCNRLGRMPLPLGTQEGSGKGACLCQETGTEGHVSFGKKLYRVSNGRYKAQKCSLGGYQKGKDFPSYLVFFSLPDPSRTWHSEGVMT